MECMYKENQALCQYTEIKAVSVMPGIARKTINLFLDIMGVQISQDVPLTVRFTAFMDEFMDDGDWLLRIVPSVYLDFLLDIWEKMDTKAAREQGEIPLYLDEDAWNIINYLSHFGILSYKLGNTESDTPNKVFVVKEIMDAFYFQLRSKKTQATIDKYEEWDILIQGMLKSAGLMNIQDMKAVIERITECEITFSELLIFIRCRTSLWGLGKIYYDKITAECYFASSAVENPPLIYQMVKTCECVDYKEYTFEQIYQMYLSRGVITQYPGVNSLLSFLIDDLQMDYYRSMVLVSKIVNDIQNGSTYEQVQDILDTATYELEEKPEQLTEALQNVYDHLPVFGLKGYSHAEYNAVCESLEKKKKREIFSIIK